MRHPVLTLGLCAAAWLAPAQDRADPAFEVISVKPSAMQTGAYGIGLFTFPGGRIRANLCTLEYLISEAFSMQTFQIRGAPRWSHEERFDIEASPPAGSKSSFSNPNNPKLPPNQEQRLMMRALLANRFHLKYHLETKEGPVYYLTRSSRELKLQPAKNQDEYPWVGSYGGAGINGDGLAGTNTTMALMAQRLSTTLGRPVLDRTGLAGAYDFGIESKLRDTDPDLTAAIMASVQSLGLKLEAAKGPVQVLVIDQLERPAVN